MAAARVLLIDDDAWLGEQFAHALEQAGFDVATCRNGLEGMDQIDAYRPDCVVLDLFMPGPNGIVLIHELRSHDDLTRIPVILCTNSASDIDPKALQEYGVARLLDKVTMVPDDLVAAVRKALL